MHNTVFIETIKEPKINRREILRYSGIKEETPELSELVDSCIVEAKGVFSYNVCYITLPVSYHRDYTDLTFAKTSSRDLLKYLKNTSEIVLFAATVGIGIDRLITRYSMTNPSRTLIFQAIGAERIESLCDAFSEKVTGCKNTPRFSPGYGDLQLDMQKDIFSVLDCSRKIGLTLNKSLLMTPTKSVTAIISKSHISKNDAHSCKSCNKTDCEYRTFGKDN